ncbi:hypothetical protein HMPREF9733_00189 [Treponema denticola SP33]|uniref:Uncharacterized protein n=1 Tax=Treponema denticola SP33 TaxID=999437 RepID=M2BRM7_TREDN|nr:hypothetical protein HMPREF9733_00189 [Treponema denticola SP33]EPF36351.1 hypothetical protein HMPREF9732_01717 [Treponema denticola SP32]
MKKYRISVEEYTKKLQNIFYELGIVINEKEMT